MTQAEQVRQILASKGLTLYRVSQLSREIFGRFSPFCVPRNLYRRMEDPSLPPDIHQLFALSRITNYQLCDWLAVFGFDLDWIPRLGLMISRKRTILLDPSIYNANAWIPWFAPRAPAGPLPPVAPLGQILSPAEPRRASHLSRLSRKRFLYAKIGQEDANALSQFAPGSIVRVDPRHLEETLALDTKQKEAPHFLVEHGRGWTCSQLMRLEKDLVILNPAQRNRCWPTELRLGEEARILGVVDAEIRPLILDSHHPPLCHSTPELPRNSPRMELSSGLGALLCRARVRSGLTFREASATSRFIADVLRNEHFFAAASTLSDCETLSAPPRRIEKAVSLCAIYGIGFWEFLCAGGIPLEEAGREPIPDELVLRQVESKSGAPGLTSERPSPSDGEGFLGSLVEEWEEIPLFLRHCLADLSRIRNFSLSDVFWVGAVEKPLHPWLANASFVTVNRRIKRPALLSASKSRGPRLYVILKRDGGLFCGCCALDGNDLIVPRWPGGRASEERLRNGVDAEIIGEITAIVRRLAKPTRATLS